MKLSIPAGVLPEREPITNDQKIRWKLDAMQDRLNVIVGWACDIEREAETLREDIAELRKLNTVKQKGETLNDTV